MKLIGILQWQASHKCIGLVYANTEAELGSTVDNNQLMPGSMAYTGEGSVYVFNGTTWNEMGA